MLYSATYRECVGLPCLLWGVVWSGANAGCTSCGRSVIMYTCCAHLVHHTVNCAHMLCSLGMHVLHVHIRCCIYVCTCCAHSVHTWAVLTLTRAVLTHGLCSGLCSLGMHTRAVLCSLGTLGTHVLLGGGRGGMMFLELAVDCLPLFPCPPVPSFCLSSLFLTPTHPYSYSNPSSSSPPPSLHWFSIHLPSHLPLHFLPLSLPFTLFSG